MELDYNKLLSDISSMIKYLIRNERQSSMEVISDFYTYAGLLEEISGIKINTDIFMNTKDVDKYKAKFYYGGLHKFLNFLNENGFDLADLSDNLNSIVDKNIESYVYASFYKTINRSKIFSEKEFKDILLSFFSEYGNNVYKVVKNMFDEKRINLGAVKEIKSTGYTVTSTFSKSAYIVTSMDYCGLENMVLLAHEFGHVIHFYTSVLNNGIKNEFMSPLKEVPSCAFEVAFLEYLYKNHIETSSTITILNDKFGRDLVALKKYSDILRYDDSSEIRINLDGEIDSGDVDYSLIKSNIEDDIIYTIGFSAALNMFVKYGEDKKEFMNKLNNFMYIFNRQSFNKCIEALGIDYNDYINCRLITPYVKSKQKELIKKLVK